jgi:hypothetical protein
MTTDTTDEVDQLVAELVRLGPEALPPFLRTALKIKARAIDDSDRLARIDAYEADDYLPKDAIKQVAKEDGLTESGKQRLRRKRREARSTFSHTSGCATPTVVS